MAMLDDGDGCCNLFLIRIVHGVQKEKSIKPSKKLKNIKSCARWLLLFYCTCDIAAVCLCCNNKAYYCHICYEYNDQSHKFLRPPGC